MTTDFRALCAFMLRAWEKGDDISGAMTRARALLAQPEEGVLTDEELETSFRLWWIERYGSAYCGAVPLVSVMEWTRHAATRWGRPAPEPPAEGEVGELVTALRDPSSEHDYNHG